MCMTPFAAFTMLLSFMPTNYDGDPGMPDYSDSESVFLAATCSGTAIGIALIALALLRKTKVAWIIPTILIAVNVYRFAGLVPHFEW